MAAAGMPTPRHHDRPRSHSAHSTPQQMRDHRRQHAMHHTTPPNYDIYGVYHHRIPYKDKSFLESQNISHPRWLGPRPEIRSRSELMQARKRGQVPDPSYDFDGDGVIGQLDYFVGRSFDKDADGRLSRSERLQAEQALNNGLLDKYVRGLDSTGDRNRLGHLTQKRGIIIGVDNHAEACAASYPPHFNAQVVPPHPTHTALKLSRTAELKGAGHAFGERLGRKFAPVCEPQPPNHETEPRTCHIAHIRERAEADYQASRVRAGLLPMAGGVNPERENRTVGLGYEASPVIATRSQLNETRKELMKRDCEDLRAKGEELFVPLSVRRAEKDHKEFEFRRPEGEPRTLTVLRDERKRDRIEYDMANFHYPDVMPREYPRYADNPEVPFWVGSTGRGSSSRAQVAMPRHVSEPVLKVNEVPFQHEPRETRGDLPEAAHQAGENLNLKSSPPFGARTVKRFTTEAIESGQGRNKPRLFNSIQPIPVGPKDLEDLDLTSSMEPIRSAALLRQAEERKKSGNNPRCSRLWSENIDTSLIEPKKETPAVPDRTQIIPKKPEPPTVEDIKEPKSYSSPDLRNSSQTGVRSGGFQKLDWLPKRTGTRPLHASSRQNSRTNQSSAAAAPAPPL